MLLCGDEIGRSQAGNNNAYCQDNEISWVDWEHADYELCAFVEGLIALRRTHPAFRRRHFRHQAIGWYRNDGAPMTPDDWNTPWAKAIGMFLDSSAAEENDNDFYVAFNADREPVEFIIPHELGNAWRVVLQTACPAVIPVGVSKGTVFRLEAHSLLVAASFPSRPNWPG
jgi:isoamylase